MHNLEAKTIVHHTDTVSVIVSCSMKPVLVDHEGRIRLSNILTSVEEGLLALVTGCAHTKYHHCQSFDTLLRIKSCIVP